MPTYDYLLATAALNAGNPSRATFIYERILAINPEFIGVRADMGRAYYQMGDLARAKLEFESILALTNIPPDLRTAVETYLCRADPARQRQVAGGRRLCRNRFRSRYQRARADLQQDRQRRQQPEHQPQRFRPQACRQPPQLRWRWRRVDRNAGRGPGRAYVGGDLRGREYNKIDPADNYSADARIGLQYATGNHLWRAV